MAEVLLFTETNGSPGWGRDGGCYAISSRLREQGFSTQVVDFFSCLTPHKIDKIIKRFVDQQTLMVGFSSSLTSTFLPDHYEHMMSDANRTERNDAWNTYFPFSPSIMEEMFLNIKKENSECKIVVGGQKVVQKRRMQEKHPGVDIWVEGMADTSIVEICRSLKSDKGWSQRRVKSEDEYPFYSDFTKSRYHWDQTDLIFENEALPLEITRGCPFRCTFCDYKKKNFGEYIKDPKILRNELLKNYEDFGVTQYMILDFLVNEDIKKTEMIHEVFTSLPFKIEWSGFGRLDLLTKHPEMRELLYESGARSIMWGIESLNKNVGKKIRKNCDKDEIERLLYFCKELWKDEVIMGSGFIVGLPGETRQGAREMMEWLTSKDNPLHGFEVTPLYIGSYNPEKASRIDYSDIQKNPEKFGYALEMVEKDGKYQEEWKNIEGDFDKDFCIDLIEEYQARDGWKSKKLLGTYHHYSRLRNLNFNHSQILSGWAWNQSFVKQSKQNYLEKAEIYFSKLMEI